jgi:hypothetical protein
VVVISQSVEQQAGFMAQETLIFMGTSLGALALVLLAVALGLQLVRRGELTAVRGRRTRIEPED